MTATSHAGTGTPGARLRPGNPALALAVVGLAALAWSALTWSATGAAGLDHHGLDHHGHTVAAGQAVRTGWAAVAGWALMVVAMMLPPALPMLDVVRRLVGRRAHPRLLVAFGAASFVGVWTGAGTLLVAGDAALHATAERVPHITGHPHVVAGVVLVGAGLYQFTPLKDACLRACRTPRGFAVAHWRGRRPAGMEVATVTGAYAVSCVGCCWALMALCFAVGAAALPVMVVLTVVMAAERLAPWGRRLVRPVGVVTVALGAAAALSLLPAGLLTL